MLEHIYKFDTEAQKTASELVYPAISYVVEDRQLVWENEIDYVRIPLTFKALSGDTTFQNRVNCYYSIDNGETWSTLIANTQSPIIHQGETIMFKGVITTSSSNYNQFSASNYFAAYGNPLSTIYGDSFIGVTSINDKDSALLKLFRDNTYIVNAENLVLAATTLSTGCYKEMFRGCTSLTTAMSKLPALVVPTEAYMNMFYGCTSLTAAPELPATTLARACYQYMFYACSSLTSAPSLPATSMAQSCYNAMFRACTGLTTAPVLSAETLVNGCYNGMFWECSSLNGITCLAITGISDSNSTNWVNGVAATGTFTKDSDANWSTGVNGIPDGWFVVDN